jgi:pimeloyl-ACP methyl ester carboxylesterase
MANSPAKKKHKPSLFQLTVFISFLSVQRFSYKWASLLAYHLWFHPGRSVMKRIPLFEPEGSQSGQLNIANKSVRYWSAGEGPNILLVHGWASCGSQFASLAKALLEAGFRVTWFDAPAHGQSTGFQTNLFEVAECILKLEAEVGALEAIVAHSFGSPCSLSAINQGLKAKKFIAINTPATAQVLIEKFCDAIRAHDKTREHLISRLHKTFNENILEQISAQNLALNAPLKSLVIHDKDDPIVSVDEGRAVQQNLSNSSLLLTDGLGHNRILSDPLVIQACVKFISS